MYKYILGFDNGTTAHFTLLDISGNLISYQKVPTYQHPSWKKPKIKRTKTKTGKISKKTIQSHFTFVDIKALKTSLYQMIQSSSDVICYIERPAVNFFMGWQIQSSLSAFGAWQAVLYVLQDLGIKYITIDSKEWQNALIPEATGKNNKEYLKTLKRGERNVLLKQSADAFAKKLFPQLQFKDQGDGDSCCIAEYYRRIQIANKNL